MHSPTVTPLTMTTYPLNKTLPYAAFCLLALVLAAWLSWSALDGPFVFDDFVNLSRLSVLGDSLTWEGIGHYLVQFSGALGRPLSVLSFLIDDHAWPSEPYAFKRTNLLLHLLTGVLLFGFTRSLLHASRLQINANLVALLACTAWLIHPIQLSTTMLVVQRMTILGAIFTIASLWAYTAIISRGTRTRHALASVGALGTGTLLATLCKESGALTPLFAWVLHATILRTRLDALPVPSARICHWGIRLPIILLLLAILLNSKDVFHYDERHFDLLERAMTQARVLIDYLRLIVLPRLGGSSLYHDDIIVSRSLFDPLTTLPAVLANLSALATAIVIRKRLPLPAFALLWFYAGHMMESTIIPLELYFEHRNYLPMYGIILAGAFYAVVAGRHRTARIALFALWLALAGFITRAQAHVWGSEALIAKVWAMEKRDSMRAQQQLASYLERSGQPSEAIKVFQDAWARGLHSSDYPFQSLIVACKHDLPLQPELLRWAASTAAEGSYNHTVLGVMSILREQAETDACGDAFTAQNWWDLSEALLANPNFQSTRAPAYLHIERAYYLTYKRDLEGSMREYEAAYALSPTIELSQLMAATLVSAGLTEDAIVWLERGLTLPQGLRMRMLSTTARHSQELIDALRTVERRSMPEPTSNHE